MTKEQIQEYIKIQVTLEETDLDKTQAKIFCDGFLCGANAGKLITDEEEEQLRVWMQGL